MKKFKEENFLVDLIFKNYKKLLKTEFKDKQILGNKLVFKNDDLPTENSDLKEKNGEISQSVTEFFKMREHSGINDLDEQKNQFEEKIENLLVENLVNVYFDSRSKISSKKMEEIKLFMREISGIIKRKNILAIKDQIKSLSSKINVRKII